MRRRPRGDPELARLDALTGEQRKAELDALIAESLRADEPRPTPSEPAASVPTVEQLVAAEVQRQRERDLQAAEAAAVDRLRCPVGRGCWRCGAEYSWVRADEPDPWDVTPQGAECVWCHNEGVLLDRYGDTDDDRRVRTIARLLDETGLPLRAMGDPHAFAGIRLWFSEFPAAEPTVEPEQRWSHIDRADLRTQWDAVAHGYDPATTEPEITRDDRCEECGGTERFAERSRTSFPCGVCEACVGNSPNLCHDWQSPLVAGECVDCRIAWTAQATGRVPGWWLRRKGKRLPPWARQFAAESVSA
jgi:hypothetical protein